MNPNPFMSGRSLHPEFKINDLFRNKIPPAIYLQWLEKVFNVVLRPAPHHLERKGDHPVMNGRTASRRATRSPGQKAEPLVGGDVRICRKVPRLLLSLKRNGSQKAVPGQGGGHGSGEVRMEKPWTLSSRAHMRESCPWARWIRGQVEQLRGTVVVPRGWRGGGALREAHARQMIGRVEAPGNMHRSKFEL